MNYPVAIEAGTNTAAFGVIFPDLPGCFSAGDSLDEAMVAAREAAAAWIDAALDAGEPIPPPSSLDTLRHSSDYKGWIFGVVTIDPATLEDTTERVNITLPPPHPRAPRRPSQSQRRYPLRLHSQTYAAKCQTSLNPEATSPTTHKDVGW